MSGFVGLTIFLMVLVNRFESFGAGPLPGTRLKACGSQLANLLSELCTQDYIEKRSKSIYEVEDADYLTENGENSPSYDSMIDADYGYRSKRSLPFLRMLKPNKRGELGVADECCRKSCSLKRLLGYCRLFLQSQQTTTEAPQPVVPLQRLSKNYEFNPRHGR